MELRHLRYFVGVGEEQHFGRAAVRLHVAQPALSRQIQDLEREMGFLLFDRLPRGVRLNAAGKLFLSDARRILQDVDDAKRRAERIALGKAGTLRIGIAMALSWHGMVADSFREFRRGQPDVELVAHHLLSVHQVRPSYPADWMLGLPPRSRRGTRSWRIGSSREKGCYWQCPKGTP